ncbi:transposase [Arthrobacter sp. CJ23]|uniref:transposase n=1 Tax=Arthrobacter sp. CJ23 TaxID=2972479 RepID=UPI0037C1595D
MAVRGPGGRPDRGHHRFGIGPRCRGRRAGTRGYDSGKRVNGHKRHIAADTMGLLLCVIITGASVQDRDGAKAATRTTRRFLPPCLARVGGLRPCRQTRALGQ